MSSLFTFGRFFILSLCIVLDGCQGMAAEEGRMSSARPYAVRYNRLAQEQRERQMKATWVNQTYQTLVETYGEPKMVMEIPAYRPWPASVAVYERLDFTSGCIDAFTVAHLGRSIIYDYFCR